MRRLLILALPLAAALALASNASALTAGTTLSCTFSPSYGTPDWSAATGAPIGTKTVCSKTTLTWDHNESQCRDGQLYRVPVYFGTAEIDFYLGRGPNAAPAYSIGVNAGFVEDDDNATALGTACSP
jgi:hypothetical protein